jgi:hypothetical protein
VTLVVYCYFSFVSERVTVIHLWFKVCLGSTMSIDLCTFIFYVGMQHLIIQVFVLLQRFE